MQETVAVICHHYCHCLPDTAAQALLLRRQVCCGREGRRATLTYAAIQPAVSGAVTTGYRQLGDNRQRRLGLLGSGR
jgi:hypothetical protein